MREATQGCYSWQGPRTRNGIAAVRLSRTLTRGSRKWLSRMIRHNEFSHSPFESRGGRQAPEILGVSPGRLVRRAP
jgi:hypothetical protein